MKIIRGRLIQPSKNPKKKALLIGINYTSQQQGENDRDHELRGPHRDVTEMKEFIMSTLRAIFYPFLYLELKSPRITLGTYGYEAQNIVVMLDKDEEGLPQPTRFNIVGFCCLVKTLPSESVLTYQICTSFVKSRLWSRALLQETISFFIVILLSASIVRMGSQSLLHVDAGHSTQVPSKNNSEEDGMDECE